MQLACKHPHSQQILDRQGQLLRSSEGPNPPLWLEALRRQHEKALKRKKAMHKRLLREQQAKAEADALEAARERARNRFSFAKAAAARGEPIPKHAPVTAKPKRISVVSPLKRKGEDAVRVVGRIMIFKMTVKKVCLRKTRMLSLAIVVPIWTVQQRIWRQFLLNFRARKDWTLRLLRRTRRLNVTQHSYASC